MKRARMFLVIDPNGRCLLERRPPTGLWGGLWNPPERAGDSGTCELLDELGLPPSSMLDQHHLPGFRHTFTHFIWISSQCESTSEARLAVSDRHRWRWYGVGENEPLGLSAVAVRLLSVIQPTLVLT